MNSWIFKVDYKTPHKHKRRMVTNIAGTYYRCELCGEFPKNRKMREKREENEKSEAETFKQATIL